MITLSAFALASSTGCMQMFEKMGMVEKTDKNGNTLPPKKTIEGGTVSTSMSRNQKAGGQPKKRNIFARESEPTTPSGGTPDFLADTETNIIRVNKIINSNPWLSFDPDGTRKIDGIRITVYLEAPEHPKGVFGDGTLTVQMFRLERGKGGQEVAVPAQEWILPPDKAYQWRATSESMLGKGYSLRLKWDDKAKVNGKQVAILVKYERPDGRMIASTRQVLKVPAAPASSIAPAVADR